MKDMLGRGEALSVEAALSILKGSIRGILTPEEPVSLEESFGRVLSRDVFAPEDLPGFPRSTVDGYAVFSGDTFGLPSYLNIKGEIHMAEVPGFSLLRGEAAKVPTGGMLPEGADAVLMFEHAQAIDGTMVEAQRRLAPGENVIARDEDVKRGELLLGAGKRLRPADVAVLAGIGSNQVFVRSRPRVSVVSTGDEVVPHDSPLRPGVVRDSNSFVLMGLILKEGGVPIRRGIIKDEYEALEAALTSSVSDSDMVLLTGGSSVGMKDMVSDIIAGAGRVLFHGVSMKPGKPLIFGITASGRVAKGGMAAKGETNRDVPVFGLPGHPASAVQCFDIFVRPALSLLLGAKADEAYRTVRARLTKAVRSQAGRVDFYRVSLQHEGGELCASPVLGKSGLVSAFLKADGTVEVPAERLGLEKDELVDVRLIDP